MKKPLVKSHEVERPSRSNGVDAAMVVGAVLRGMVALKPPCRLRDLEKVTGISPPKLHRYLVSMIESGLVRKSDDGSRYQFGLFAFSLAQAVQNATDLVSAISPRTAALAEEVGESVGISLWMTDSAAVVRWFQGSSDLSIVLRPNVRLGLTTSTTGQVFGAFLPREVTEPLVIKELRALDTKNLTVDAVYKQYAAVHMKEVAVGRGMRVRGINSLSAPVFDQDNGITACITVLGPEVRLDTSEKGKPYRALTDLCRSLSSELCATRC